MRKLLLSVLSALLIPLASFAQNGLYVGGDISLIPSYEASKTVYLDENGNKISDLITWLRQDCGWNSFRVRLFVNPQKMGNDGKTADPAVCQDIDYVKSLGKRIKDAGAQFMLDIHYSDTYVDATHIQAPAAWKNLTVAQKAEKMYSYTKESLETLVAAGAKPDLVQVGNEIMYGLCGVKVHPYASDGDDWDGYISLLTNGCKAVREVCPEAKIIIHTDRPANTEYNKFFYGKLVDGGVDFDVIGLSYYPFWHGWLTAHPAKWNDGLINALNTLKTDFPDKKVQIVETAYNFQYWPTSGVNYDTRDTWPCSAEGQYKFMKDLVAELANHDNVEGLFYWCPEEAGCGDNANWNTYEGVVITSWLNRGLWWSNASNGGHWPITTSEGSVQKLMKNFLAPEADGIDEITTKPSTLNLQPSAKFNLSGQKVNNGYRGIVIENGRKCLNK